MGGFGDVVYEGGEGTPETQAGGGNQLPLIDINDPRLTSEALDDTSADAYAVPPPPPDGKWRAKIKAVEIKEDGKGTPNPQHPLWSVASREKIQGGTPFFIMNAEVALTDLSGKNDGVKITENWIKSLIDERKGTSQMSTIAKAAGAEVPARSNDVTRRELLLKTLAGEPEIIIETQWEAQCQACQEKAKKAGERAPRPFLRGMHTFPQVGGKPSADAKCPVCGSFSRAQARIAGFFSVKDAKPTRGIA